MSRELRNLLAKLEAAKAKSTTLMASAEAPTADIVAATAEIAQINAKIEAQKAIDEGRKFNEAGVEITEDPAAPEGTPAGTPAVATEARYSAAFCNALRGRATAEEREILAAVSATVAEDGQLLIPSDIQTRINEYKRTLPMLEDLITVEPVTNVSGSRVFERIATMVPLTNVTDFTADIADMGSPKFDPITYAIKDYAGIMPVPNNLIADSDQSILNYLIGWIAKKSVVTRNSLILAKLLALSPITLADWKAIKKAINITLDPIFSASAKIVVNQDGYQYLDTLVDGDGRALLQPDASEPGKSKIFGKQIVVLPNTVLLTTGTGTKLAPIFIGNLAEAITMFERQGHLIASTNIGGTSFQKNQTHIRAIEREDIVPVDTAAVVYGKIDVTAVLA